MSDTELTYFERRLLKEIEDIERRINDLQGEQRALERQLAKARAERAGVKLVERRNSAARVLAENSVLLALRQSQKPMKVNELYKYARRTNYDLKEATFRSYLHRMKKRGELTSSGRSGWWQLASGQ